MKHCVHKINYDYCLREGLINNTLILLKTALTSSMNSKNREGPRIRNIT